MIRHKLPGLCLAVVILALLAIPVPVQATGLFSVIDAEVYNGYLEDGDWLIVIEYQNTLQPYYGNATPNMSAKDAFVLQLTYPNGTLIAQTPMPAWEYRPGSIYLSATTVASLEWGVAYNITMNGTDGANTTSYTLTAIDWRGSNLAVLDDWCLTLADRLEAYYNLTFLVPAADATTEALNGEGGLIFAIGIPHLDQIRPNLFQITTVGPEWETSEWTEAYPESLPDWEVAVGSTFATVFNSIGTVVSLDGQHIGAIILFIVWFAMGIGTLGTGHGLAGLVLASPIIMAGWYFNLIHWAVLGVAIAIVALILVRQFAGWRTG